MRWMPSRGRDVPRGARQVLAGRLERGETTRRKDARPALAHSE